MLESLVEVRPKALKILNEHKDIRDKSTTNTLELEQDCIWNDMNEAITILRPLADCIGTAERASGTLGEAIHSMLKFTRFLFSSDESNSFNKAGMTAFLSYFNVETLGEEEMNLMLAAYAMDRRYKLDYLTPHSIEKVLQAVWTVATKSGFSPRVNTEILTVEFYLFIQQKGDFHKKAETQTTASEWCSKMPDVGVLRKVALRLADLKSSSANTERIFSILKLIQGPNRTRLSLETMEDIARAKNDVTDANDNELFGILTEDNRLLDNEEYRIVANQPRKQGVRFSTLAKKVRNLARIFGEGPNDASCQRVEPGSISQRQENTSAEQNLPTPSVRENYSNFFKYIDFSIENSFVSAPVEESSSPVGVANFDEEFDVALKKLRTMTNTRH